MRAAKNTPPTESNAQRAHCNARETRAHEWIGRFALKRLLFSELNLPVSAKPALSEGAGSQEFQETCEARVSDSG
jgi:hypothetical protein